MPANKIAAIAFGTMDCLAPLGAVLLIRSSRIRKSRVSEWRAQEDDFGTFLGDFVSALHTTGLAAGLGR